MTMNDPRLPCSVCVEGVDIRYGIRGTGDRNLLLVHGSGANHMWWHAVAPELEASWRVVSFDLSGHGDSGHREDYDAQTWADELIAVLQAADAGGAVVAAHSLGGRVALLAASQHPELFAGLVLFDTGIWAPDHLLDGSRPPRAPRPARVYATREEARSRFRLMPPQPQPSVELLDPAADYALRPLDGGWAWKHDQRGFPTLYEERIERAAAAVSVPVAYISGSASPVVDDARAERAAAMIPDVTAVRLPSAHHHLTLEVPDACTRLVQELGGEQWDRYTQSKRSSDLGCDARGSERE
jgi:pimeloyl-ACP methyl ester carboxylesterase